MFTLPNPTIAKLKHINLRTETHGKEKVSACDLDLVLEGPNTLLDLLDDRLLPSLYWDPEADKGQALLDDVKPVLAHLRFTRLGKVPWSDEGDNMALDVIYGLGDARSNIVFGKGKATMKNVELKDGGTVAPAWRFSTSWIEDGAIDKLRHSVDHSIEIMLTQNEPSEPVGDVIDGSVAAFEADHPEPEERDATDLFVDAHGDER